MKFLKFLFVLSVLVIMLGPISVFADGKTAPQNLNKDSGVDILDLVIMAQEYATAGGVWPQPLKVTPALSRLDFTKDDWVARDDFETFAPYFGGKLPLPWAVTSQNKLTTTWGRVKNAH